MLRWVEYRSENLFQSSICNKTTVGNLRGRPNMTFPVVICSLSSLIRWLLWCCLGKRRDVSPDNSNLQFIKPKKMATVMLSGETSRRFPRQHHSSQDFCDLCNMIYFPDISWHVTLNACVKGHLEPTHLKSSPLFTFSTKSLGQDSPSVHLFSKIIGSRFTTAK